MEFAVVLPVVIIMVLGILEIGNALRASHALENALREGGRLAVVQSNSGSNSDLNTKVSQDLRAFVHAAGFSGSDLVITITDADTNNSVSLGNSFLRGRNVRIQASLPFDTIEIFPRRFLTVGSISCSIVVRIPEQ